MLHIKLKGKKYRLTRKQTLSYKHPWPLGQVERSDIEIVLISLLGVGEMGFIFCDLYISLK